MYRQLATIGMTLTALTLASNLQAKVGPKVIYKYDSRVDVADSPNANYQEYAKSTAAQMSWSDLNVGKNLTTLRNPKTLRQTFGVCSEERFASQPAMANCSGFLVGPDLLVTAGHCSVPTTDAPDACDNFAWVFDYTREGAKSGMDSNNVYGCKEVLVHALDSKSKADYALIRLDRVVEDREPLSVRSFGKVRSGSDLVMIGHPSGLPKKIADGANVKRNDAKEYFVTDLDAFGGNSGSAVLNAATGDVEGILVRGARDYRYNTSRGCYEVNLCQSVGGYGCGGESVSRITSLNLHKFLYSAQR